MAEPLIERELWAPGDPDGDEEPTLIGTLRVTETQLELSREGMVFYSAPFEHWALSMCMSFPLRDQPAPPGSKVVVTRYPDGRQTHELLPLEPGS
jgi:hypothetical protein